MTKGIERPDEVYEALIELHRGLDAEAGRQADARLILLLAAEIGDAETLKRLVAAARKGLEERSDLSARDDARGFTPPGGDPPPRP